MIVIPVDIECLIQIAVITILFETLRIITGKMLSSQPDLHDDIQH